MTILVTGATGNVGGPLTQQLLDAGHQVRALTRDPSRAQLPAGAEVVAGDLADTATLTDVFTGVTAAHLIGFGGDDYASLTNGAEIMELALKARRPTSTGPSTPAVCRGPRCFRGSSCPTRSSGPSRSSRMASCAKASLRCPSALIHDADIASVALAALTTDGHAGKEYWLTGPEALTMPERVAVISSVIGREVRYVELGKDEMVERWRTEGYSDSDIEFFLMVRSNPGEGSIVHPTVEQVTGAPARPFAQWVRVNASVFRA